MRPLVLVHGFMGGSAQWAAQAPLGESRPFFTLHLPGFGQRAAVPPLPSIAAYGAWVPDRLRLDGIETFDLLGHSMGGMIVQEMVRQAPSRVARLIHYGTGPVGLLPGRFEMIEASIARAEADGALATARRIAATWFLNGQDAPAYAASAAIAQKSAPAAIRAGLEAMRDWSGAAQLAAIACPTLILWGAGDRTYPRAQTDHLAREIAGARVEILEGCAHAVHMERPAAFHVIVLGFLESA